jgi:S-adenosylmethionine:tRNA ribosyltransferase-isomerase
MEKAGTVPLPPYIRPDANRNDEDRYRTVYERIPGSVAAPTAGLHFDDTLLERLEAVGVRLARLTLHVGAGTFLPIRHEDLSFHTMHPEFFELGEACAAAVARARAEGGRVVAVGTTSLRTLECCADPERPGLVRSARGETRLFVRPGFGFRVCDAMLTNFHLPRSTLLMLVSAFAGCCTIRDAYAHAIHHRYRFYSYGDACFLHRDTAQ